MDTVWNKDVRNRAGILSKLSGRVGGQYFNNLDTCGEWVSTVRKKADDGRRN